MCKEYKCYTKEKNDALYICKILYCFAVKCLYMPVCVSTLVFKHGERYEIFILIKINLR